MLTDCWRKTKPVVLYIRVRFLMNLSSSKLALICERLLKKAPSQAQLFNKIRRLQIWFLSNYFLFVEDVL